MQRYPSAVLFRLVKSGNRTSYSNNLSLYSGRQAFEDSEKENPKFQAKIYPNPTAQTVNFEVDFLQNTDIEILVYNELGKSTVVFKGNLSPSQVVEWNIPSNYPKGLYFYKILSGNEEIKTGKILYQ